VDAPVTPDAPADADTPHFEVCEGAYQGPVDSGVTEDVELTEASGLAASALDPNVVWSHNDSGDSARLFALHTDGQTLARHTLRGVEARDFEDIARGPCPGEARPCLWVGDMGDNGRARTDAVIYVVPEPRVDSAATSVVETTSAAPWSFPISYPGGPLDAEGLVVAPDGSTFYVFEKSTGATARVFVHPTPLVSAVASELTVMAEIRNPGPITGADLHPLGQRLLVRTYSAILEYRFSAEGGMADIATVPALQAGSVLEPQGEAIGYDALGTGFWTLSENGFTGRNQALYHWGCSD
jgi:hypothetical protein